MKEAKFIELLNLYLDQQIEPADAELLEKEILRRPDRRRTYREYCRMHRACSLLLAAEPAESAGARLAAAMAEADSRVHEFPAPRRRLRTLAWAGGVMAAAAGLAVLLALRPGFVASTGSAREEMVQINSVEFTPVGWTENRSYTIPVVSRTVWNASGAQNFSRTAMQSSDLDWLREFQIEPLVPVTVSNVNLTAPSSPATIFRTPWSAGDDIPTAAFEVTK